MYCYHHCNPATLLSIQLNCLSFFFCSQSFLLHNNLFSAFFSALFYLDVFIRLTLIIKVISELKNVFNKLIIIKI